jgi:hypothetical protein
MDLAHFNKVLPLTRFYLSVYNGDSSKVCGWGGGGFLKTSNYTLCV